MKNECVDAVMAELEAKGLKGRVEYRGKHLAIVWNHAGAEKQYIVAATPSDVRAVANARADIRRILRNLSTEDASTEITFLPEVRTDDGVVLTSSRHVAEVFEKEHKNVLRDIDNILKSLDCSDLSNPMFRLVMSPDGSGIMRRTYDLTRDGFALLAMGFSGQRAIKFKIAFIEAFNAMERALNSPEVQIALSQRVSRLEGDLEAATALLLSIPSQQQEVIKVKRPFVRPSVARRLRKIGVAA